MDVWEVESKGLLAGERGEAVMIVLIGVRGRL